MIFVLPDPDPDPDPDPLPPKVFQKKMRYFIIKASSVCIGNIERAVRRKFCKSSCERS